MKIILVLSVAFALASALPARPKGRVVQEQRPEEQPEPQPQQQVVRPLLVAAAPQRPPTDEELAQNQNAQYQFAANIEDHINDLSQQREEVRDGLNVKGVYSYSDGYFKRTVHYEADNKGYRVTGEEVVPLDGPKIDLGGTASVNTAAHGTELKYTVQSVPADGPISKVVDGSTIIE